MAEMIKRLKKVRTFISITWLTLFHPLEVWMMSFVITMVFREVKMPESSSTFPVLYMGFEPFLHLFSVP